MLRSEPVFLPVSRRFRALVHVSALLLLLMSVAQATHHHGLWSTGEGLRTATSHTGATHSLTMSDAGESELTCPLCLATHAVPPAVQCVTVERHAETQQVLTALGSAPLQSLWSYTLFGRPPPQI